MLSLRMAVLTVTLYRDRLTMQSGLKAWIQKMQEQQPELLGREKEEGEGGQPHPPDQHLQQMMRMTKNVCVN